MNNRIQFSNVKIGTVFSTLTGDWTKVQGFKLAGHNIIVNAESNGDWTRFEADEIVTVNI